MKKMLFFFSISISILLRANLTPEERDIVQKQSDTFHNIFENDLPVATEHPDYVQHLKMGHVPGKKESCGVHTLGASILLIDHPDISQTQRSYSNVGFSWNVMDLDTNILGASLKFNYKVTANSIEASTRIPDGYGLAKIGIKIEKTPKTIVISIRDKRAIFDSYYSCEFFKK
jgi:hypothetical protein